MNYPQSVYIRTHVYDICIVCIYIYTSMISIRGMVYNNDIGVYACIHTYIRTYIHAYMIYVGSMYIYVRFGMSYL